MAVKSLDTLIRLHKRRIDVLRSELRAVEEERTQLISLSHRLQMEFNREVEISASDGQVAGFFGAYASRVRKRQKDIAAEVLRLDGVIEAKTESIRLEFAEQKKFEIAKATALQKEITKEKQRHQVTLDEIGNQQFVKLQEVPV